MNAACIVTYRDDASSDRRDNLYAVLARLARSPDIAVVVVEQDAWPHLAGPLPHPSAQAVFVYNAGPFNKSWGFNVGARVSAADVLAFCDADVLIGTALDTAVGLCERGYALVKPYRRIVDLTREETLRVRAGQEIPVDRDAGTYNREGVGEVVVLCGGLFVISRHALDHLGGFDERFVGWGGEDDAMTFKVEHARLPAIELDAEAALHLWHPRSSATTLEQPHYHSNVDLLRDYRSYEKAELARLAEVQRQANGNRFKYQPA